MLKLEGNAKGRDIIVRVREVSSVYNKVFWQAFALALMFHGMAILGFNIQPFSVNIFSRSAPVQVEVDRFSSSLVATEEVSQSMEEDLIGPPPSIELPLSLITLENDFPYQDPNFKDLEEESYALSTGSSAIPLYFHPLQMEISGPLAYYDLIGEESIALKESKIKKGLLHKRKVQYQVKVDGIKGTIFWYRLKSPSITKEDRVKTEELLKHLQFEVDPALFEVEGEISFLIKESLS